MSFIVDQTLTSNMTITSINKLEYNETLLTEIPIERINGVFHRFRFQVENLVLFFLLIFYFFLFSFKSQSNINLKKVYIIYIFIIVSIKLIVN